LKQGTLPEKSADSVFFNLSQYAKLLLPTKRIFVTIAIKWSNFFLHRMGKALCECPFALHRQQPEKYKQNIDVSPLEKFLRMPMERGLGPF